LWIGIGNREKGLRASVEILVLWITLGNHPESTLSLSGPLMPHSDLFSVASHFSSVHCRIAGPFSSLTNQLEEPVRTQFSISTNIGKERMKKSTMRDLVEEAALSHVTI